MHNPAAKSTSSLTARDKTLENLLFIKPFVNWFLSGIQQISLFLFIKARPVRFLKPDRSIIRKICRTPFLSLSGTCGYIFVFIFIFFSSTSNFAQVKDTTLGPENLQIEIPSNTNLKVQQPYHSPKKSALMSAIIPGSGQVYNKKYWKVPVIYAAAVGLGYSFNFNQTKYLQYFNAYKVRLLNGPGTLGNYPRYSDNDLNTLQQSYKRSRNLTVIGIFALYLMNIVDASVDAHMFTFDVGDDLSFNIRPTLINTANLNDYSTGLSLNIKF